MNASLLGSEGKGADAKVSAPFVRGQIVWIALGARGQVGTVEFIGDNERGEERVCVRLSPAWRHFAAVGDVRTASAAECAMFLVREAKRIALAAL